ncbi:MAG TPA: hypothetical protein VF787_01890 [Thermoanaerobaculia bacterium]
MTLGAEKDWRDEFGLDQADASLFFANKADVVRRGSPTSQAHVIRHAFDLLELDGALCTEHAPLIYFKKVHRIDATAIAELHRKFWNHGGAPVLAVITCDEVHVYSALVRPVAQTDHTGSIPALVEILRRASGGLRELLPALESGEFFRRHARSFEPAHRVDRALLDNLESRRFWFGRRFLVPDFRSDVSARFVLTCRDVVMIDARGVVSRRRERRCRDRHGSSAVSLR